MVFSGFGLSLFYYVFSFVRPGLWGFSVSKYLLERRLLSVLNHRLIYSMCKQSGGYEEDILKEFKRQPGS